MEEWKVQNINLVRAVYIPILPPNPCPTKLDSFILMFPRSRTISPEHQYQNRGLAFVRFNLFSFLFQTNIFAYFWWFIFFMFLGVSTGQWAAPGFERGWGTESQPLLKGNFRQNRLETRLANVKRFVAINTKILSLSC